MIHLLFFAALVATANGLTCNCVGTPDCKSDTCTVASGKCYSFTGTNQIGTDEPIKSTLKGCQDNSGTFKICEEKDIFITAGKRFSLTSNVTCCDSDNCNKDIPELKPNTNNNNLVCPSCFALSDISCTPETANCTGNQTRCLNVTGKLTKGSSKPQDFVGQGCATPTVSFLKNGSILIIGDANYSLTVVTLGDAKSDASKLSSCLTSAVLLLSAMGLWLDKILY